MAIMIFEKQGVDTTPQMPTPISKDQKDWVFALGSMPGPNTVFVNLFICQLLGPVQALLFSYIKECGEFINESLTPIPSPFEGWTFIRHITWAGKLGLTVDELQKNLLNLHKKELIDLRQNSKEKGVWFAKTNDRKLYEMMDKVKIYPDF